MLSKRSQEGVILIDHRNSPGISPEFMAENGINGPVVEAGQIYESALTSCCQCGTNVILNPKRTRAREYCMACDSYLCDGCGLLRKLGHAHKPLRQTMAELYDKLSR